ncbi:hypothetical protein Ciccas_009714, partial [Cichlidogyrus casuarinus]
MNLPPYGSLSSHTDQIHQLLANGISGEGLSRSSTNGISDHGSNFINFGMSSMPTSKVHHPQLSGHHSGHMSSHSLHGAPQLDDFDSSLAVVAKQVVEHQTLPISNSKNLFFGNNNCSNGSGDLGLSSTNLLLGSESLGLNLNGLSGGQQNNGSTSSSHSLGRPDDQQKPRSLFSGLDSGSNALTHSNGGSYSTSGGATKAYKCKMCHQVRSISTPSHILR